MMNINGPQPLSPIRPTYEPKEQKRGGSPPSEELLAISQGLKEALEELSVWTERYPLMHGLRKNLLQQLENEELIVASKELTRLGGSFYRAHAALVSYAQQIPEPSDAGLAFDLQKIQEQAFTIEIAELTGCLLGSFGTTSWGALLARDREVVWSATLLNQLFSQIPSPNWRKVRQILQQIKTALI